MKTNRRINYHFSLNRLYLVFLLSFSHTLLPFTGGANVLTSGNVLREPASARLASFRGVVHNGGYQVSWETVIEENVRQYDIEYSHNNKDFQRAGIVSGADRNLYTYSHNVVARPVIYYRLKIVDMDGSSNYSNTITVIDNGARKADFIAPTIIRDRVLNLSLSGAYKNVQVFNNAGIEVFREYIGEKSGNRIGLNLPDLPAGPYYVKLIGSGIHMTSKVMIM